jgi:hypothetical protein
MLEIRSIQLAPMNDRNAGKQKAAINFLKMQPPLIETFNSNTRAPRDE